MHKIEDSAKAKVEAQVKAQVRARALDQVSADLDAENTEDEAYQPLSREEAEKFRRANPSISPWGLIGWQLLVGFLVALVAFAVTGKPGNGWSALYGALATVLPAAAFAHGLSRQRASANAGAALAGVFVWEMVKIALTVAMLVAAPRLIGQLNWLALLAGFVVTMKVYWVAIWLRLGRKSLVGK